MGIVANMIGYLYLLLEHTDFLQGRRTEIGSELIVSFHTAGRW